MSILGISDGRVNSGATLVSNNRMTYSVAEERYTRIKIQGGFPKRCISYILEHNKDVEKLAFGGIVTPFIVNRLFRAAAVKSSRNYTKNSVTNHFFDFVEFKLGLTDIFPESVAGRLQRCLLGMSIRKDIPTALRGKPIFFYDHHLCHAASAFYTQNKKRVLCITCDGCGDGISFGVYLYEDGSLKRLHYIKAYDSYGMFYETVTSYLGFTPKKHEGKVTGLAAYGDPKKVMVDFPFELNLPNTKYLWKFGISGLNAAREKLSQYKKEDVAAWLQDNVEKHICRLIEYWVDITGIKDLVLSGGVFSNVKLNQRVHEIDGVKSVYIFPQMDDAGLSVGAAFLAGNTKQNVLKHLFLGPEYSEDVIRKTLEQHKMRFSYVQNIEAEIAHLLAEGHVVARFNGRMEYGPRALGNRSILCQSTDVKVNDWLNKKLKRTEFMPFAPSVLAEHATKCFENVKGAEHAAKFMTMTFNCMDWMKQHCPGVVHVDGTARPQLVLKEDNASFYKIIKEYYKLTGLPCVINTSFNMHEEPIVCSPEDSIRAFKEARLEYLAIGNYMVSH
jgi:carbamoyltransferase